MISPNTKATRLYGRGFLRQCFRAVSTSALHEWRSSSLFLLFLSTCFFDAIDSSQSFSTFAGALQQGHFGTPSSCMYNYSVALHLRLIQLWPESMIGRMCRSGLRRQAFSDSFICRNGVCSPRGILSLVKQIDELLYCNDMLHVVKIRTLEGLGGLSSMGDYDICST